MNKFDYLEVSGSYADVGRAIGSKFKKTIQSVIKHRKKRIPDYDLYLKKTEPYFQITKETFPNLILELEATAKAAEVSVPDYFALNNREVTHKKKEADHCTIAVSFGKGGPVVGHNEDWEGATPDAVYILKATIGDTTFMGLQYKVHTPGVAVSMNSWGLVQCINELNNEAQFGVPKNIVARAVLQCKTLEEAETLIRNTKRASGYNHVLVQGSEMRNIEIAGDKLSVEKVTGGTYVHTNHYLTPEMIPFEKYHTKSSVARYERAMKMILPEMNKDEMQLLLSDRAHNKYPISRDNATLGSVVAVPKENKMYICYGPSKRGEYNEYAI